MNRPKLRILIADDHALLRCGLKRLLLEMPEVGEVGEAETGNQARQSLRVRPWDILLLDLDMPGQNSLDVLKIVRAEHPKVAVLILSMYPESQFGLRTLKAGAAGYLSKESAPEHLMTAIRRVGEGGAYISASLAASLATKMYAQPVDRPNEVLPDREFAVLRGIAAGKSVTEIAEELNLSVKTVSTYRSRVLARLNLHSNIDLARYATEHGLVK
jgi:DNA-binding NarL/FixJ family response regulator